MWEKLTTTEKIFSLIVVMGSIVDIFQFTWIIKKAYSSVRDKVYANAKKELILEGIRINKEAIQSNEEKPFIGFNEGDKNENRSSRTRSRRKRRL